MTNDSNTNALKGYLLAGTMTLIFCIHYLVAKWVLEFISPWGLASLRGIVGGLVLLLIFHRQVMANVTLRNLGKISTVALFMFVVNQVLFLNGLKLTTPTSAAVLSNLIPLATCLFAISFRQEEPSRRKFAGLAFGFGAVFLYFYWQYSVDLLANIQGNAMILANVFVFALGLILAKKWTHDIPGPVLTGAMLLVAGCVLLIPAWSTMGATMDFTTSSTKAGLAMFFEIVVSTSIAYLANILAFRYINPTQTMAFAYFQPVVTGLLVWIFFATIPSLSLIPLFLAALVANLMIRR